MHGRNINSSVVEAINSSPLNRGLDGTSWCSTPGNVPFVIDDDVILFDDEGSNIFEVHFLLQSRGRQAIIRARSAISVMFVKYGAELIFGMTPKFLRHACMHARLVGGKYVGDRETPYGTCQLFVLSKEMWEGKQA